MVTTQAKITINQRIEPVFKVISSIQHFPEWMPNVVAVRSVSDETIRVGTEFQLRATIIPYLPMWTIQEVTAYEPPTCFVFLNTQMGGEHLVTCEQVDEITHVNLRITWGMHVSCTAAKYIGRKIMRSFNIGYLQALKQQVEGMEMPSESWQGLNHAPASD